MMTPRRVSKNLCSMCTWIAIASVLNKQLASCVANLLNVRVKKSSHLLLCRIHFYVTWTEPPYSWSLRIRNTISTFHIRRSPWLSLIFKPLALYIEIFDPGFQTDFFILKKSKVSDMDKLDKKKSSKTTVAQSSLHLELPSPCSSTQIPKIHKT